MINNELVAAKIELLPNRPGVYLMKDKDQNIIYVGKAKSLIKRVKQYFTRPQEGKVLRMVREIEDFDTIETTSEKEALLLEINLIQKYYPKFNILLKDGKSYPFIALKKSDPYLKIAYKDKDKNYRHFGPYPNSKAVYSTIELLNKIYPIRKCNVVPKSPCLYYHLGQCLGQCINKISKAQNDNLKEDIVRFLNGDNSKIKSEITKKMKEASENLEFEKAQEYKIILEGIEELNKSQAIDLQDKINIDVINLSLRDGYIGLCIMTYIKGSLLGKKVYVLESFDDLDSQIEELVYQFYMNHKLPNLIIVPTEEMKSSLSNVLDCKVASPSRGKKKEMLLIALENAKKTLDEHFLTARLEDDNLALLEELARMLNVPTPLRIELFDNSHIQGAFPVGAMVVFINGVKAPSEYRKFNINDSLGNDDLRSMSEVLQRRYSRLMIEEKKMPDLIIVDGGQNQINVALEVMDNLGLSIPVAGLYKDDKHHTAGLLYKEVMYPLDRKSKLFLMLVRMQDEVHRFAISFHKQKRGKGLTKSFLDDIKGLGKKRLELILKTYPTLEDIKKASIEELQTIVPLELAITIKEKADKL